MTKSKAVKPLNLVKRSTFNEIVDLLNNQRRGGNAPRAGSTYAPTTVLIYNPNDSAIVGRTAIRLEKPLPDLSENMTPETIDTFSNQELWQGALTGTGTPSPHGSFAISVETIEPGNVGTGIIQGITTALVDMENADDEYAYFADNGLVSTPGKTDIRIHNVLLTGGNGETNLCKIQLGNPVFHTLGVTDPEGGDIEPGDYATVEIYDNGALTGRTFDALWAWNTCGQDLPAGSDVIVIWVPSEREFIITWACSSGGGGGSCCCCRCVPYVCISCTGEQFELPICETVRAQLVDNCTNCASAYIDFEKTYCEPVTGSKAYRHYIKWVFYCEGNAVANGETTIVLDCDQINCDIVFPIDLSEFGCECEITIGNSETCSCSGSNCSGCCVIFAEPTDSSNLHFWAVNQMTYDCDTGDWSISITAAPPNGIGDCYIPNLVSGGGANAQETTGFSGTGPYSAGALVQMNGTSENPACPFCGLDGEPWGFGWGGTPPFLQATFNSLECSEFDTNYPDGENELCRYDCEGCLQICFCGIQVEVFPDDGQVVTNGIPGGTSCVSCPDGGQNARISYQVLKTGGTIAVTVIADCGGGVTDETTVNTTIDLGNNPTPACDTQSIALFGNSYDISFGNTLSACECGVISSEPIETGPVMP